MNFNKITFVVDTLGPLIDIAFQQKY